MLDSIRVLDLTDDRGHLAGLMLAQLGAQVTLLEPPDGHRTRHRGPYIDDQPGPDRSLEFLAYNRGKNSIALPDLDQLGDQLSQLCENADVLIECGAFDLSPADLDKLRSQHPHLVTASISAFGQTGPKADWAATDLTIAAASGTMWLTGDRDRAPVRIGQPQTWLNASADAAGAVLIALHEKQRSGMGQHIDVSANESFADCTQFQMMAALVGADTPMRLPGAVELGQFKIPWVYECADGHVTVAFLFGSMIAPYTTRLLKWLAEDEFVTEELRDRDWVDYGMAVFEGRESIDIFDGAIKSLQSFVLTKTKAELLQRALDDQLLIAPITTTADVLALDHLTERDYWQQVQVPGRGKDTVRFCGALAKVIDAQGNATTLADLAPAPELGAGGSAAVASGSGGANNAGAASSSNSASGASASGASANGSSELPLADIKIVDFMWAVAGPATTRTLADYGAQVVKVESETRIEVLRGVNPFIGEDGDQEGALQYHSLNASKLGLTLDLSVAEAREVVLDLVRWADVLTESFSPKAMVAWGLSYKDLVKENPSLVMFSSCLMGQSGPMRLYAGFGTMAAAIAGFYPVTGWPDRIPAGPFTAYTDYTSPRMSVPIILAALEQRDKTGKGCHIDFAQLEGALHMLSPCMLDEEINGRTAGRYGNADPVMCPHAVYPATGEERWIAVACETQAQWEALASVVGMDDLSGLTVEQRHERAAEIDQRISEWTQARTHFEAQDDLQAVGVPAHVVNDADSLVKDPQMVARERFVQVPHPKHEMTWVENSNYKLSRTQGPPKWGGPMFGQHNTEVLEGILGYDGDKVAELVIAGAIA